MSSNIQIVQQCYAEFGKGNIQGVLDLLADDIRWADALSAHEEIPFSGEKNGKEEVGEFFAEMAKHVTYTAFEPQHFFSDGDTVIVRGWFAGKGNETGKTFESDWVMIWEVVDGKATSFRAFSDTLALAQALERSKVF